MSKRAGCPLRTCRAFERMNRISAATEADIVEEVQGARARRTAFEIVGAGSKRNYGRPISCRDLLDVSSLKGIVAYQPEELIVTVLPGTPVVELEAALAEKGQRLGFDPPDWGPLFGSSPQIGTIAGAISTDACGPARVRYGAVRDQLLGFRAVNGLGEAFKAGGKVVKNVTGFDIPKLVCGAFGTLCILTELTLRVFPKPSRERTFAIRDIGPEEGFALLRKVWASPLEATGLGFCADSVVMRVEGEEGPLAEKVSMLKNLCGHHALESADGEVFRAIGNGDAFLKSSKELWRLSIPPSKAADVVARIGASLWVGDCAGAILWLATNDLQMVREVAGAAGSHATLMKADAAKRAALGVFEAEDPARAQLTRSVKAAFDPLGLFNPGRMWDGV
jgi:glycolate oxidase FAD binding subunit